LFAAGKNFRLPLGNTKRESPFLLPQPQELLLPKLPGEKSWQRFAGHQRGGGRADSGYGGAGMIARSRRRDHGTFHEHTA
jgi:hypothetical protein